MLLLKPAEGKPWQAIQPSALKLDLDGCGELSCVLRKADHAVELSHIYKTLLGESEPIGQAVLEFVSTILPSLSRQGD